MRALLNVLRLAWPALLGVSLFLAFGRYGFNPTDEGFINEAAHRILDGQVPHRDFIWPRPAGSSLLHAPEQLLPTPLLMTGRAIALAQVVAYTLLFAVLVVGRAPWRWRLWEVVLVSIAVLLNLNTMLLTIWPTFDGLLLVAAGAVLQRRAMERSATSATAGIGLAFLLYGLATLTKQSFLPAPVFGIVWLVAASRRAGLGRRLLASLTSAALPPLAYVAWIALAGGLDELALQLGSARPATGVELITELSAPVIVAMAALLVGILAFVRLGAGVRGPVRWAVPIAVAAVVGGIVVILGLRLSGGWGTMLWWLLVLSVLGRSLRDRRVDWPGMVLIGSGWMASLSYGLHMPNLLAGSLAVYLVHRAWEDVRPTDGRRSQLAGLAAALVLALLVLPTLVSERLDRIYRDRPSAELTEDLGSIDPDFAGVLTSPVTAEYVRQLAECVESHPADRVAVLPDNPVIYPALGIENPMPSVWIIPLEVIGSEERLVDAAASIDRAGDYLVLFQPLPAHHLASLDSLEAREGGGFRDEELGARIRSQFSGEAVECGTFEGYWSP